MDKSKKRVEISLEEFLQNRDTENNCFLGHGTHREAAKQII